VYVVYAVEFVRLPRIHLGASRTKKEHGGVESVCVKHIAAQRSCSNVVRYEVRGHIYIGVYQSSKSTLVCLHVNILVYQNGRKLCYCYECIQIHGQTGHQKRQESLSKYEIVSRIDIKTICSKKNKKNFFSRIFFEC
jgi:hypothetical protein